MNQILRLIIFFSITTTSLFGQETIRLDFYYGSSGDYEIYIKKGLERIGYKVFINYPSNKDSILNYDYIVKYKDIPWFYGDELKKLEIELYDSNGYIVNKAECKTSYVNFGINPVKKTFKTISKLMGKKVYYKKEEDRIKKMGLKNWNVSFYMNKIDAGTYAIVAEGAAIRTSEQMKKAFFMKADLLLNSYLYYFEESKYVYNSTGPVIQGNIMVNLQFQHTGIRIGGVIINSNIKDELKTKPIIYSDFLKSDFLKKSKRKI